MTVKLFIGTSGWHYDHWTESFYPAGITGYKELQYLSQHFNTVENNSSFYRIAHEPTYKTWSRMTPDDYKFSIKLNKLITHVHRLEVNDEVRQAVQFILDATQVLQVKLGAIVIQLPPSFRYDIDKLDAFLKFFRQEVDARTYSFDIAIEFRSKHWFINEVYAALEKYNVALVAGQSSRYPEMRRITADFTYLRMHGPDKLFASTYSTEQLIEVANYIKSVASQVNTVYVYFNNDFHGYALQNAKELMDIYNKAR